MAEEVTELRVRQQRFLANVGLDAVLDESIECASSVTSFPIELGADINDHVIRQPKRYVMRGIVTDTPTTWASTEYPHGQGATRSLSAWRLIEGLWQRAEPFEILTGFGTYSNLVVERLRSRKNSERDRCIDFEADLRELRIVETRARGLLPAERYAEGLARDGHQQELKRGKVEGVPLTEDKRGVSAKLLDTIVGGLSGG